MKIRSGQVIVVTGLLFIAATRDAVAQEWKEFRSAEGRFKILMPGEPQHSVKDADTPLGKIQFHSFLVAPGGNRSYLVAYWDIPGDAPKEADVEQLLKGTISGAVKKFEKPQIAKEMAIKLDGHPGREVHFTGTVKGATMQGFFRSCLVGKRVYQIGVIVPAQPADEQSYKKMLDSFALLPK